MSAPDCGSGRLQTAQQSKMTVHDQFGLLLEQHTHTFHAALNVSGLMRRARRQNCQHRELESNWDPTRLIMYKVKWRNNALEQKRPLLDIWMAI